MQAAGRGAIAALVLALAGCGNTSSNPPERPLRSIQGIVFASPVSGATVRVWAFHDGRRGDLLGEVTTDAAGRFALDVKTQDGVVLLEASGGTYREEASGRDVTVSPQPILRSLVRYSNAAPVTAGSVTTYTTLATGLAEHLIGRGQAAEAAMDQAFAAFNDALGLDVRAVTPLDITDPGNATGGLSPGHEYGFHEAAVSQWTADAGTRNGTEPHATHTSISFAALGYDDIRADGVLDGRAGEATLRVGTIPLTTDVYRLELALALLRIARGSANRTGLGADRLLPTANRWNESTVAMFGEAEVTPLSEIGPVLTELRPAAGARVSGRAVASVTVDDPVGLLDVSFALDGQAVGSAVDASTPRVEIDTAVLPDGPHQLRARARNLAGGTAELEHEVIFDNTAPSIAGFPAETVTWCGAFSANATVSDAAMGESVFLLDNVPIGNQGTATAPAISINSQNHAPGNHTLTLRATDAAGNVSTRSRTLTIPDVFFC